MPDHDKVVYWKSYFADYSDEALLLEKHKWVPSADMHVAAVQLLHDRERLAQQKALDISRQQHEESLRQEKILHRKTQFVAWLAVIASVFGIAAQFYLGASSTNSAPSIRPVQSVPTALSAPFPSSSPPIAKPKSPAQPPAQPSP